MTQETYERLVNIIAEYPVKHEAFELLADLRMEQRNLESELECVRHGIVYNLGDSRDYENLRPSNLNYLQCIRRLVKHMTLQKPLTTGTGDTHETVNH